MTKTTKKAADAVVKVLTPEAQVNSVKRYVDGLLRKIGADTVSLGYQVEALARDFVAYRKVSKEYLALPSAVIEEQSREGDNRIKPHPLGMEMRLWSDVVRKDLAKLTMNIKDAKGQGMVEDGFTELMSRLGRDDDDG